MTVFKRLLKFKHWIYQSYEQLICDTRAQIQAASYKHIGIIGRRVLIKASNNDIISGFQIISFNTVVPNCLLKIIR